jgi:hypothetical protein
VNGVAISAERRGGERMGLGACGERWWRLNRTDTVRYGAERGTERFTSPTIDPSLSNVLACDIHRI